ncbi:MAG TPA: hypothetical protein VGJ73_12665 [Verrucomicrobiae bacterium]
MAAFSLSVLVLSTSTYADQITLQNGDVLNGKVVSMTTNSLVLQDESLGTLTLSRLKVSNITFGAVSVPISTSPDPHPLSAPGLSVQASSPAISSSPWDSDLRALSREIRDHSNLVQEVEAQVLGSSASPAAVGKFNEILDELGSGQMDMNGLRSQAQSAADQLQDYKKEMGSDAGEEVDSYLAILNTFLHETSPTNGP